MSIGKILTLLICSNVFLADAEPIQPLSIGMNERIPWLYVSADSTFAVLKSVDLNEWRPFELVFSRPTALTQYIPLVPLPHQFFRVTETSNMLSDMESKWLLRKIRSYSFTAGRQDPSGTVFATVTVQDGIITSVTDPNLAPGTFKSMEELFAMAKSESTTATVMTVAFDFDEGYITSLFRGPVGNDLSYFAKDFKIVSAE